MLGGGGFTGFFSGRELHVMDNAGLGDPLMARLPMIAEPHWRIGHFRRAEPAGYADTLRSGVNQIGISVSPSSITITAR